MPNTAHNYPLRVAVIMGKYTTGGIKSVIMNYYRHIDKSKVQFDIFVYDSSTDKDYTEIENMGGKVIEMPSLRNPLKHIITLKRIFREKQYKCIHGYLNTLNVFPMLAGKLAKVPVRISENLSTAHPGERKSLIKNVLKPFSCTFPTHIAANSKYSAVWMYGEKRLPQCEIFNNGLDLNVYKFNPVVRQEVRQNLGLEDNFVIGHIGRYQYQKNHNFLIDIFNALHKKDPKSKLLLVGYGKIKNEIFEKIARLGLSESVIDCGQTENIMPLYNAMDCFVLPSYYEGLPVVGIEAQATGLPCIMSTEVTDETAITQNAEFISLEKSAEYWADKILKWKNYNRKDVSGQISRSGYDIVTEAKKLEKYYFSCLEEKGVKF